MRMNAGDVSRRSTARMLLAAGLLIAAVGGPGSAAASASRATVTAPGDIPVPVRGSTVMTASRVATGQRATVLVNGVRRIPGATVLYFSVGLPVGSEGESWAALTNVQPDRRYDIAGKSSLLGNAVLVDLAGRRVYSVLIDLQENALASPTAAWSNATGGAFYALYEVLPELPAGLTKVDVLIGNGDVIQGVPIEEGVLEPAVEQIGPLPLGQGWPRIDQEAARKSLEPEKAVHKLITRSADLNQTVVKRETPGTVAVDLSADVLFASGSARLGPAARAKVQAVADLINSRSDGSQVKVTGYTDNAGSSAHGELLSKQRARAVAGLLKPLVTLPGVTYAWAGRGERNPVASNQTATGRKLNRRVTVTFTPEAAQ